ncbi:MAG: M48 family metallopeptidase [Phycisphaerae bacterium]|nr:M48 family metallopeptidase [Phycisphaerae bacterium]
MKKIIVSFMLSIMTMMLASCSEVAFTGRSQLNFIPDSIIEPMAASQYDQFIKDNKLSTDKAKTAMVKRVGADIAKAVEEYAAKNYIELKDYQWQFELIDDETVNAFAMPGGKIVVYTGILEYASDEDMVAAVIGHEIAHVLAKHGSERMTQQLLLQFGGLALDQYFKEQPEKTRELLNTAYGATAQVGVALPFSRKHENEADHMGTIFMAMAGYNPEKAIELWQTMAEKNKDAKTPPEFLSTHPANQTRIDNLKELMPEAKSYAPVK